LILTGSISNRAGPEWPHAKPRVLSDQEVLSARCYFDWLKLWLPSATQGSDWNGDRDGRSNLLRWTFYPEHDSRLAGPPAVPEAAPASTSVAQADPAFVARLLDRVTWQYPFAAAVEERSKATVTELRQRGLEEEEETVRARFVQPERFQLRSPIGGTLTAAEIGTAHHRFLQAVLLTRVGSVTELRSEAARLQAAELLSDVEMSALDLDALARFWESEPGQRITANATAVRRELPFTARFSPGDLRAAGLSARAGLAGEEYVVVQGVIDLAVLLPGEIWLLDFKTDRLKADQIEARAREYDSQLRLYAQALERIYGRRVTNCWLHFLSVGQTVEVIP
jgi:ATP-dependent helicase/nuclease subunit A